MSDKTLTTTFKTIIFYFFVLFLYLYLHEFAGHYFANILSGISAEEMEVIWFKIYNIKLLPFGITVINGEPPRISYFAGGFMAGLIFLLVSTLLFLRLYKKKRKELYWWFFNITLAFSIVGFTEFVVEGFFTEHHRGIIEIVIMSFFTFFFAPLFGIWHFRKVIFGHGKIA